MKTIQTKYHGPTNTKGARISATDGDTTVYIPYPYELSGDDIHIKALEAFCNKMQWQDTFIGGHTKTGMVFVFASKQSPMVRMERVKIVQSGKMPVEEIRRS